MNSATPTFAMMSDNDKEQQLVNYLKGLIMDGVRQANSGHTGGAFSSVDFAYVLFQKHLRFDPEDSGWFNRDRFILSAGHESMLIYSLLHLQGYLDMEELKNFRQLGSKTPGHPEYGLTAGVEATTGPLGQGVGMAVGMALAAQIARSHLGEDIVDSYTYALCGDGDLQEPVALGTCQLAGHYGLNRLILFYDFNKIQISGQVDRNDSTDIAQMFRSFQWNVLEIDGNDHGAIDQAILHAQCSKEKPTIIIGHTTMAKGCATMEGSADTHGAPLPHEEIAATKRRLGIPEDASFYIPQEALNFFRRRFPLLREHRRSWEKAIQDRAKADHNFTPLLEQFTRSMVPPIDYPNLDEKMPTRKAFGKLLEAVADQYIAFAGGSADLEPSNNTTGFMQKVQDYSRDFHQGRSIPFGVREFPMGAIINGMQLYGIKSFGATFLVFSDYMRASLRLAALQNIGTMFIFTHDSVSLGEDGPTHQPIEHLPSLRLIPGLHVLRPADALETRYAFDHALHSQNPTVLALTRQDLEPVTSAYYHNGGSFSQGGYILRKENGELELVIIATGSEVKLALDSAAKIEETLGKGVRVVNMPCCELFDMQSADYRNDILPPCTTTVAIEAAATGGWYKYTGRQGLVIGIDQFGESAPADKLLQHFGFTQESVVDKIIKFLK
ncbi:transketolase [Desulfurispira natronophila]|uniref:Transketolase n=1 Tax=Desulfurispira natronophila TaxID=682562 RepID=A0A7W7Y279_9BACT|nr:transketolase [Desulfurispira natronophila]MBB5020723.1 transketolase [Desulfurispira natronophila]